MSSNNASSSYINNALSLYVGSNICLFALVLTRQAYKLSDRFRTKLADETGYYNETLCYNYGDDDDDIAASSAEKQQRKKHKAEVMRSVFRRAWPATVSEMLQDTETAHGMVFRSLMIAGCLIMMQTDFKGLTPPSSLYVDDDESSSLIIIMDVIHVLRKHIIALSIGFCFAPATGHDHAVASLRKQTTEAGTGHDGSLRTKDTLQQIPWLKDTPVRTFSMDQRRVMARTSVVGTVHTVLAIGMLLALPFLELIVVLWESWHSVPSFHLERIRAQDPCSLAYCTIAVLRLVHIVVINFAVGLFGYHFLAGFYETTEDHAYKGFWAEFAAAKLFAQLMVLASIQSFFSWPTDGDGSGMLRHRLPYDGAIVCVVAVLHVAWYSRFCIRTFFLCLRNIEYTDNELCRFYNASRKKELVFQTFLDAQLAFIARLQQQQQPIDQNDDDDDGFVIEDDNNDKNDDDDGGGGEGTANEEQEQETNKNDAVSNSGSSPMRRSSSRIMRQSAAAAAMRTSVRRSSSIVMPSSSLVREQMSILANFGSIRNNVDNNNKDFDDDKNNKKKIPKSHND